MALGPTPYRDRRGDDVYGIDVLEKEELDGINEGPVSAVCAPGSLRLIKDFQRQTDVVVLPSLDTGTSRFLVERIVYRPR